MIENPSFSNENIKTVSFLYGGIGLRKGLSGTTLDEHDLLRNHKPRFRGHVINRYSLPDVDSSGLKYDGKYTTETGWDDNDPEVTKRYVKIAKYAGINTLAFTLYGGIDNDGTENILMEKPLKNFLTDKKGVSGMLFAPMICAALPRLSLPVKVPIEDKEDYRFKYISEENLEFLVKRALEQYYLPNPECHFTIDNRPVIFLFDYVRIAIEKKFGMNTEKINRALDNIRKFSLKQLGIEPFFIGIINNAEQAEKTKSCKIDIVSNYIDLPYFNLAPEWPIQRYQKLTTMRQKDWTTIEECSNHPFVPALVSGFDATSRVTYIGRGKLISPNRHSIGSWYPLIPVVPNEINRPAKYREYIEAGIQFTKSRNLPLINFGPMNEITEQCSLLPSYSRHPQECSDKILMAVKYSMSKLSKNE